MQNKIKIEAITKEKVHKCKYITKKVFVKYTFINVKYFIYLKKI